MHTEITHIARETVPYACSRTISYILCTFKRFHDVIFHQSARYPYHGPVVKVGSLVWSARMTTLDANVVISDTCAV